MNKHVIVSSLLVSSLAWAQPTPTPTTPTPAPADPNAPAAAPTDPNTPVASPPVDPNAPAPPVDPNATPTPVPEQPAPEQPKGVNQPRTEDKLPVTGVVYDGPQQTDGGSSGSAEAAPTIAVELSLMSGGIANQFVQYKGWTLENGIPKGFRLEGNFYGLVVAYELSNMSNDQACSDTMCVSGDFGSTTVHMLDVGYRYRFGNLGPVRPYLAASLGGALASFGDWAPDMENQFGGTARGGFGIEIPLPAKLFASAFIGYRLVVTPNPLRDADKVKADKVLVSAEDEPNGDFAEDLHSINGYVGIGMAL